MKKGSFICVSILLIFAGCHQQNTDKVISIVPLKHQVVLSSNEILIAHPKLFTATDSLILICDPITDSLFHLVDKQQKKVTSFGRKGNGPDEFLFPASLYHYPKGDSLCMMDSNKRSLYSLRFLSDNTPKFFRILNEKETFHRIVLPMSKHRYISSGVYNDARFYLLDKTGNIIDRYEAFPYRDEKEQQISKVVLSQAYDGYMASDTEGERFAVACYNAKMIAFYKIENNKIVLVKEVNDEYPDYKYSDKHYQGISRYALTAYISVTASNNYVYALYSGKSYGEHGGLSSVGTSIWVYDWMGNLVRQLALDVPVSNIQIMKDDKSLYAIISIPEPEIVKFDIP